MEVVHNLAQAIDKAQQARDSVIRYGTEPLEERAHKVAEMSASIDAALMIYRGGLEAQYGQAIDLLKKFKLVKPPAPKEEED